MPHAEDAGSSSIPRRRKYPLVTVATPPSSGLFFAGSFAQPGGQFVSAGAFGGLGGGEVVMADPAGVAAAFQQQSGGFALAAVGGAPQRVVEVVGRWRPA